MRVAKPSAPGLFRDQSGLPSGFGYWPEAFSKTDETGLVKHLASLPFKPFEFHGYLGNRRVVSYGFRYDYGGQALRAANPIPDFLYPLREIASAASGIAERDLEQALVTEYAPGAGIGWHRDKPMFEKVVALSFLEPCVLRLRKKQVHGWRRHQAAIEPRSCYLMSGDVRELWEHSIAPMDALRYSVTFRSFKAGFNRPIFDPSAQVPVR